MPLPSIDFRVIPLALCSLASLSLSVRAQIIPDQTLGPEASELVTDQLVRGDIADLIEGGATRGGNLFHSFSEFDVGDGQRVYFANPAEITSILSRITGNNISEISGTLGVDGTADLFLINPNGLVFGENSQLDIEGSLYGTTAEAVEVGDGVFSAAAPEQSQLLATSPSVSFWNYLTDNSGDIVNRGQLAIDGDIVLAGNNLDLQGQIDSSTSIFGNAGDITLLANENIYIIGDNSRIDASSTLFGNSGNINVFAGQNIFLEGERSSSSRPRIESNIIGIGQGGNVSLQARSLLLKNAFIDVSSFGRGNAGSVFIDVDNTLTLEDGSNIFNEIGGGRTNASGNTGGIFIEAEDVNLIDSSEISNTIQTNATGTGGGIHIETKSLFLQGFSQIATGVLGEGISGNIKIHADKVFLDGVISNPLMPGVFTLIGSSLGEILNPGEAIGRGGDISIEADNITLSGAQIFSSTFGQGNAGNVTLKSNELITLSRESLISSSVSSGGNGRGGDIIVDSTSLVMQDGAEILSIIRGTERIEVANFIIELPAGQGIAGDIFIRSQEGISIADTGPSGNPLSFSGISTAVGFEGTGVGGNIEVITEGDLLLTNGASLRSTLDDESLGLAGNINVQASNIFLNANSAFDSFTAGKGDAGDIKVVFFETLTIQDDSSIRASTFSDGNAGNIVISGGQLLSLDRSTISAQSLGQGNTGEIVITLDGRLQALDGTIETIARSTSGGQIQIDTDAIYLFEDSDVQTFVNSGDNNGGNITINANALVALDDSDILAFAADGRGGNVDLSQTAFFGQNFEFAPPGTDPRTLDNNDRVDINASGGIASGTISLADVSFIQDSLTELPDNLVNPEALVASSCIARSDDTSSGFTITGGDSLPQQPSSSQSTYSLSSVQSITDEASHNNLSVIEPHSVYRLADGRLVMSQECEQ